MRMRDTFMMLEMMEMMGDCDDDLICQVVKINPTEEEWEEYKLVNI